MAVTGFFHHIGTFLIFTAFVLLIITDISSPVVNRIPILRVNLGNATNEHPSALTFGTFGWCTIDTLSAGDVCSGRSVGYPVADVAGAAEHIVFSDAARNSTFSLSKVMILHPVATGICFVSFILNLGAGIVGGFLASLVALIAFLVTVVVCITDFVLFSVIKVNVNDKNTGIGGDAFYSTGMWTLLASAICTFLAAIFIFFTCCSSRLHRQRKGAY